MSNLHTGALHIGAHKVLSPKVYLRLVRKIEYSIFSRYKFEKVKSFDFKFQDRSLQPQVRSPVGHLAC